VNHLAAFFYAFTIPVSVALVYRSIGDAVDETRQGEVTDNLKL
jgi:hypothetical protein